MKNSVNLLLVANLVLFSSIKSYACVQGTKRLDNENAAVELAYKQVQQYKSLITSLPLECLMLTPSKPDDSSIEVDIYEDHKKECGGDPLTAPRIISFLVKGQVVSIDRGPNGEFIPLDEYISHASARESWVQIASDKLGLEGDGIKEDIIMFKSSKVGTSSGQMSEWGLYRLKLQILKEKKVVYEFLSPEKISTKEEVKRSDWKNNDFQFFYKPKFTHDSLTNDGLLSIIFSTALNPEYQTFTHIVHFSKETKTYSDISEDRFNDDTRHSPSGVKWGVAPNGSTVVVAPVGVDCRGLHVNPQGDQCYRGGVPIYGVFQWDGRSLSLVKKVEGPGERSWDGEGDDGYDLSKDLPYVLQHSQ